MIKVPKKARKDGLEEFRTAYWRMSHGLNENNMNAKSPLVNRRLMVQAGTRRWGWVKDYPFTPERRPGGYGEGSDLGSFVAKGKAKNPAIVRVKDDLAFIDFPRKREYYLNSTHDQF
ncbi:MAG: hypothetical protein ACUVS1_03480 [Actinomycetota bacterium]